MPELKIAIGGREFTVACQEGEEHYLTAAAGLLDAEASSLTDQIGRMPESRMLLMAGLMLADKTAGTEDRVKVMEEQIQAQQARISELENRPAPAPERVEVPVIPSQVTEAMAELAARAEAMAEAAEERAAG